MQHLDPKPLSNSVARLLAQVTIGGRKLLAFSACGLLLLLLTAAQDQTISVNNTVNIPLGNVTLANQSEQKTLNITGSGNFTTDMNAEPSQITIGGETLVRPAEGPVSIGSEQVLVKWYTGYVQIVGHEEL